MICPNCKSNIPDDSKFCPDCGTKVAKNEVCPHCGAENLPKDSMFCPECGCKIDKTSTSVEKISELEITVNNVSFKMIMVESGSFTMGATPEMQDPCDIGKPAHQVTLTNDYYIGETEVTQALWKVVMGNNPSWFKGDKHPVENVSWDDCKQFISRLNTMTDLKFRIPIEAEWEFAARGGNNSNHYKYSGSDYCGDVAWYKGNSGGKTNAVRTRQPNELGIYDMSGNVWEWCADWYGDYNSCSLINPAGINFGSYRVIRGGSWNYSVDSSQAFYRQGCLPSKGDYSIGLRLALYK